MVDNKVFLVTGAGRGMGVDIVPAALAAGHQVVATGRNPERVSAALGIHQDLLVVALDVTDPAGADAAVQAAVDRFGRIDVLVNNAGSFYAGFFEKLTPHDFRAQIETNLFGPLNVTRAVLPVMRAQRSGLVVALESMNGVQGGDPAKLATALIQLTNQDQPPLRWITGADAVQAIEQKAQTLLAQANAHRQLSSSLSHETPEKS